MSKDPKAWLLLRTIIYTMKSFIFVAGATYLTAVWGHIQVRSPPPFKSPFDPWWRWPNPEPDWNYKSPLHHDGSDFPCKHHHKEPKPWRIQAEYDAGSHYQILLDGTATHLGGSCQISISYDSGHSFRVIKSFEGGCPLNSRLNFTVPAVAATYHQAILSWTWFNREGNREMYQNCIPISIWGKTSQHPQQSLSHLPLIYECNINNGCQTYEYHRVCFPYPGPVVVQGNDQHPDGSIIHGESCPHRKSVGTTEQDKDYSVGGGNLGSDDEYLVAQKGKDDGHVVFDL